MKKLIILSIIMSLVSLFLSLLALVQSQHSIRSFSTSTVLLSPECQVFKDKTPQTAEEVAKLYGISPDRVEMYNHHSCPRDLYWGYYVHEGEAVDVTVPKGGEIIIYAAKGYNGEKGSFYSGTHSAMKFVLFTGMPDDN